MDKIELDHGGGGQKSWEIVKSIRNILVNTGLWENTDDDGAVFDLGGQKLVFTTDGFIVDPLFFPGGDIGKIAMAGTINDVAVMGARPIGVSLSIILEEGFPKKDLEKILTSINEVSEKSGVPIVTGDTKVSPRGKIDKIEITTAGVGLADKIIVNSGAEAGDVIITSGDLGEHAVALLASRFNYQTNLKSDCKNLNHELLEVGKYLKACKDPTRGGLGANIVEIANKSKVKIILEEDKLPYKKETIAVSELLGIDIFSLASEGRFIASVDANKTEEVIKILQKYEKQAKVIGRVEDGEGVFLETKIGSLRKINMPAGKLIPRIC